MAVQHPAWQKSSYSADNGSCVEVAAMGDHRAVRDSKSPASGDLLFSVAAFSGLLATARRRS